MATNNEKNIQYWLQRTAERRLINSEDIGNRAIKDVVKMYEQALRNINNAINSIYVNYSNKVGLSVDELTHIISGTDRASFFKSIQANMQKLGFNVDQIYNERYIYRLSRLDALKQQVYWEIAALAPQETTRTGKAYIDIIDQTYRDAIEGRRMAFGNAITPSFATLNRTVIKGMLEERWHEGNYKTSVWGNVGVLGDRVQAVIGGVFDKNQQYRIHDVLPQAIGGALTMGQSYQKTARMLNDIFEVGKYNVTRLVRTESNYFENQAELESMIDDGIERYEFYAVMDRRTSKICQEHDGEIVNVEDAQVGKNYPPLHPNCRSTAMPLLKGEKKFKRLRPSAWQDETQGEPLQVDTKTKSMDERWKEAMAKQMNPNKAVHDYNADLNRITREFKGQELINELGKLVGQVPETDPLKSAIVSTAKLMGWSEETSPQVLGASGKQISTTPQQQMETMGKSVLKEALTKQDLDIIDYYVRDAGAYDINGVLRGNIVATEQDKKNIELMDKAINKAVLNEDVKVFRYISDAKVFKDLKEGDVFEEKAFMSTTFNEKTDRESSGDYKVKAIINAQKGVKAIDVSGIYDKKAFEGQEEMEIVFGRNQMLKLTGKDAEFEGKLFSTMTEKEKLFYAKIEPDRYVYKFEMKKESKK